MCDTMVIALLLAMCGCSPSVVSQIRSPQRPPDASLTKWTVRQDVQVEAPPIRFAFATPLEHYAGEIRRAGGELHLRKDLSLADAQGSFSVDIFALTMGEPDLDENVRNNVELLAGKKFPISRFTLRRISSDRERLTPGDSIAATLIGDFELKGVRIPLAASAVLELRTENAGPSTLSLTGSFTIESLRETFHILGPSGEDEPAGNRLTVEFHFVLVPGESVESTTTATQ